MKHNTAGCCIIIVINVIKNFIYCSVIVEGEGV